MKYKILLNKGITPKNTEGNMYAKICEAMEEYHKCELLKLNKSDVISSLRDEPLARPIFICPVCGSNICKCKH